MDQVQFQQKSWDLTDILPAYSSPEFEAEQEKLNDSVDKLQSMEGMLSPQVPIDDFVRALRLYEGIKANTARFTTYALLFFRQHTSNSVAKTFQTQMDNFKADVSNKTFFFEYWLIQLDDNTRNRLMKDLNPDDRYYVRSLGKMRPHTLSLEAEKQREIDNVTGVNKWVQFYIQKVGKLRFTLQIDGKERTLNEGETTSLWYSRNSKERVDSYTSWLWEHEKIADELGDIYMTIMMDWHNDNIKRRHYPTPISAFNLKNEIPDEVADLVLSKCRENSGIFRKFFSLKEKMLGMEKMSRYHIFVPLIRSEKKYQYSDTVNLVLDVFNSFDRKLGDLARRMYEEDHVDAENRENKYSGAYCEWPNPNITPYVSYVHTGSFDNVLSNVHELGHGTHTILASKHSHLVFSPQTPVAEIGSGFPELLLLEKLNEMEKDIEIKKDLLVLTLNRCYRGIPRQAYFTIFERDAHDSLEKGVTVDDLAKLYLSNLKEQFGDSVYVPENFKWEFLGIPHIFKTPFYCYSYSFANLLAISLYKQFKEEGESFKPKYINLLSYGGSKSPEMMLSEVGADIRSGDFWQGGFNIIDGMVNELGKYK